MMQQIGKWVFIAGVVLAVLVGIFHFTWAFWILALLGLVVGILNITAEETQGFLIAAIALILSTTSISKIPAIGEIATAIFENLAVFISPAMLVVALKALFMTAKD